MKKMFLFLNKIKMAYVKGEIGLEGEVQLKVDALAFSLILCCITYVINLKLILWGNTSNWSAL